MTVGCHHLDDGTQLSFFLAFKYISIRRQLGDHILGGGCLARLETVGAGRRQFDPVGDSSSQLEPVGDSLVPSSG